MKDILEFYSIKVFIWFIGLLPNRMIYKTLKLCGRALYRFEKRRSKLTRKNLKLAFPNLDNKEIEEIAKGAYESISITLAEIILMLNNKIDIDELIINKDSFLQQIKKYKQNSTHGIVIITAHFSNWELAASILPKNGYPMTVIGREGNNKLIEKNITTPFRQRYGNKNVYKKKAMLGILKTLKKNGIVGLLIDQKAGGKNSVKVKFFGKEADTTNSIATLKLKFNPTILPIFAIRESDGRYRLEIKDAVEYTAQEESDEKKRVEKITQKYNDIIENIIKEYPTQWFWMHNRWRLT